jgi:hypothetical protein
MEHHSLPGNPDQPPPLDQFKEMVRSVALVESAKAIWQDTLGKEAKDEAWIPHLEFIEQFMRSHGISF